jgi:hypothetical protein
MLHNGYAQMCSVVHEARNIVLGHLGQLFLENALQACQDDGAFALPIVVDDSEFNLPIALFYDGRLLGKRDYPFYGGRGGVLGGRRCQRVLLYALRRAIGRVGRRFALSFMSRAVSLQLAEGNV